MKSVVNNLEKLSNEKTKESQIQIWKDVVWSVEFIA